MVRLRLFFGLVCIGILSAWLFHMISMPLFNNVIIHCLILGLGFGTLSFLLVNWILTKYTQQKNQIEKLNTRLLTDNLTGLLNRRAFDLELARLDLPIYSILFIDIDNFRVFNNQYGHKTGDIVLRKVCELVETIIRIGDRAYRYGGEEIVVLLKDCDKENAQRIAEKMRTQVSLLNNTPYPPITISLGIANCPEDGESIQDVIEKADSALLLAKNKGKNRTVCFRQCQ